jgi:penicillin-binding protein 1B
MKYLKIAIYSTLIIISLAAIALGTWAFQLNSALEKSLAEKRFLAPTSYYTAPLTLHKTDLISKAQLLEIFRSRNYRERQAEQKLFAGDFFVQDSNGQTILSFSPKETSDPLFEQRPELNLQSLTLIENQIAELQNQAGAATSVLLEPSLFAQYIGNEPVMQRRLTLGEIPPLCLNSVLAIEDSQFLDHKGISLSGIGRAILSNIGGGGFRQGGSTITQQMVKNFFLTSEKTVKRKVTEIMMSVLLEMHSSKDQIFETYLNIIYLGQNGPFQIRGFGAAAEYYFQKPVENLELHECSLLAAVLNSPGLFDPFKKPTNAFTRRQKVLDRMKNLNLVTPEEHQKASASPLPSRAALAIEETAPYYVELVNAQVEEEYGAEFEGLQIFTGLELETQELAQKAALDQLLRLETENKKIKALKEKGKNLEAVLLSADHRTHYLTAVVGGRGFRKSQFNRAFKAKRQIGSVMKPIVFLAALNSEQDGEPITPQTLLKDEAYTFKYEGQSWTPQNYAKKYLGDVPLAYALINSLNASTARLGFEIGLDRVIETARILGIQSNLKPVPSVSLGSFEVPPSQVLSAYFAMANQKTIQPLALRSFVHEKGFVSREFPSKPLLELESEKVGLSKESFFELIGIMKNAFTLGTAVSAKAFGFTHPAAGKTGTTSDYKDSWFAGFTPHITSVSWVGYDDNTPSGLTGASGALPVWALFMAQVTKRQPADDFAWPENVRLQELEFTIGEEVLKLPLILKK